MGTHLVHSFEASQDAQAIWRSLTLYMNTWTRADIAIEDLLGQIISKRLTTTYKGTQQFILEWLELVRQYEDLIPLAAHFQPVLQNSLVGYKQFYDVKMAEDQEVVKCRAAIDYDAYMSVFQ